MYGSHDKPSVSIEILDFNNSTEDKFSVNVIRYIDGIRFECASFIRCEELQMSSTSFQLLKDILREEFKKLTYEMHHFINKRLKGD